MLNLTTRACRCVFRLCNPLDRQSPPNDRTLLATLTLGEQFTRLVQKHRTRGYRYGEHFAIGLRTIAVVSSFRCRVEK